VSSEHRGVKEVIIEWRPVCSMYWISFNWLSITQFSIHYWNALFASCYSCLTIHHSIRGRRYILVTTHFLLFTTYYSPFIIHHTVFAAHYTPIAGRYSLMIAFCPSHMTHCSLLARHCSRLVIDGSMLTAYFINHHLPPTLSSGLFEASILPPVHIQSSVICNQR
jgi:hypothetical protein